MPDPWLRRWEERCLRRRPAASAGSLDLAHCVKHQVILDALGRCPRCQGLGLRPDWW